MSAPVVAVDARMEKGQGIGRYIRNMVPRLASLTPTWSWRVLGDESKLRNAEWTKGSNVTTGPFGAPVYGVREHFQASGVARGATIYWAPHYNAPLFLPGGAALVVTVHDLGHLQIPELARSIPRRVYARMVMGAARRNARAIMCDSAFTRDALTSLFGEPGCPTSVVHLGVDREWFEPVAGRAPLEEPYFVFVGDRKPHKNVGALLDAFAAVSVDHRCRLVLIGRTRGFRNPDTAVDATIAKLGDRVVQPGEVSDAELRRWVGNAVALVQPSFYEGFGLPPLEAMAAGCATVVARSASLPEVCGDAPLYFDPRDTHSLAAHMRTVLTNADARGRLVAAGRAHVRAFDWDTSARNALAVFEGALR